MAEFADSGDERKTELAFSLFYVAVKSLKHIKNFTDTLIGNVI